MIAIVGFGVLREHAAARPYTQKLMGYDAWTSGLVLAPGGLGNMVALLSPGASWRAWTSGSCSPSAARSTRSRSTG